MAKKAETYSTTAEDAAKQPYYLQRAHIKDFRSIRDATVEFKPGLNIIIGPNGSGKSNFVECATSSLTEPRTDFSGEISLTIVANATIQVSVTKLFNERDEALRAAGLLSNTHQQKVSITTDSAKFEAESFLDAQYKLVNSSRQTYNHFHFLRVITVSHGTPFDYSIVKKPVTFHASLGGGSGYSSFKDSLFSNSLASAINSSISQIHRTIGVNNRLPHNSEIVSAVDEVERVYQQALLPALRGTTSIDNIRLTGSLQSYTDESRQLSIVDTVRIEFRIGKSWLPFSALSSGTQRLFYIISEILSSNYYFVGHANTNDESDTIILLEEPELGIHPDQLEKLLVFLREQSQKHQLIITTHSPQVLDMLNDDELDRITICELHKTKGTQFRKLKRTQIAAARKFMSTQGLYLSDYWRYGSLESTH